LRFGLDKYRHVFYAAWRYKYRAAMGEPNVTLKAIAAREGLTARFAQHIWSMINAPSLGYPTAEMVARWRKLPAPTADRVASEKAARDGCEDLEKYVTGWPGWLFGRGDAASGGAGDESPLILTEAAIKTEPSHHFVFNVGGRPGRGGRSPVGPQKGIPVYRRRESPRRRASRQ